MSTQLVVEVDRLLPAAPATVFRALTDPAMFALWMGPEDIESTVAFELEPVGDGTRLAIRHSGLSAEEIAQNDAGWRHQLDRLEAALSA